MGDVSSITIEELDGAKRKVELNGPSLPFQGASWKTRQNVITTWYPGNGAQATQQILGPQEMPSSWEGVWRRTLMGKAPSSVTQDGTNTPIVRPSTLRDLLDSIFFSGSRLRVSWTTLTADGTRSTVVREGRATEWEFPHDRTHDIQWKISFDWYGRGAVVQKVISTRDKDLNGSATALQSAMEAAVAASSNSTIVTSDQSLLKAPSNLSLGQLENLTNYPNQLLGQFTRNITKATSAFKQVVNIANNIRNLPFQLANTVLSSARNTMAIANQFYDTFSRVPVELLTTKRSVRDLSRSAEFFGHNLEASQKVSRAANTFEVNMRQTTAPTLGAPSKGNGSNTGVKANSIVAVHVVKSGETLLSLSQKYYSSADHAVDIAKANQLPWHIVNVDPGKTLIIPVLSSQARM